MSRCQINKVCRGKKATYWYWTEGGEVRIEKMNGGSVPKGKKAAKCCFECVYAIKKGMEDERKGS